ncbi:hypothetical protein ASPACDRAFT_127263 [Aspergillus aculeatus ATCC 16872]|uniref:Uncharacterized protein n=1 Tax=Aspergillus aculeatus (strain ATCC 16872 / CBS 172.66 / WB 5094) TaxID=690307 RepID=A0A1L9WGH9_ASPA1|nr:uncharacterized protein ASPACDRAFT_127263 [Aspergillus aculeatus ATCC 16872]OJJ95266.1 hypothetical protein ASPACDRAFT_127263 [Aspergillus aculeatus ATCC 16872]
MQSLDRGGGELSAARAAKRQRVDGLGLGSGAVEGGLFAQQQVASRRVLAQPVQPRPRPAVVDLTGSSTALVTNPAATATATSTRLQSHDLGRQRADSRTSVQAATTKSMSREEGSTIPPRQASRKEGSNPPQLPSSRKESSCPLPPPQATRNEISNPPQLPSLRKESNAAPEEPPVLLRLSTSKPRKKLMYSALLPGGGGKVAKPASSAPAPAPAPAPASEPPKNNKNPPSPAQPPTTTTATPPNPHDFTPSTSTQTILNDLITAPPRVPPNPRNHTPTTTNPNPNPNPLSPKPNPRSNIPTHTSLRKSYSDPTALTTTTVHRSNHTTIPDPAGDDPFDQGPWTREALDLFDFWPAGRAKPV